MTHPVTEIAEEAPEAAGLVYALVTASMDANFRTTDRLLDLKDAQIRDLCRGIVRIGEILDQATVIDRATEHRLAEVGHLFGYAHDTLDRIGEAT